MGNRALTALTALLLASPLTTPSLFAQASGVEAANRVAAYTAWDDNYLYLAVQVNKPELKGTNAAPFSDPRQDDAVYLSLQTDNDKTALSRTAKTYTVVVSEAGGVQLYSGLAAVPLYASFESFNAKLQDVLTNEKDPQKRDERFTALTGTVIGVGVEKKGALRALGTAVPGYTLEVRIPWSDLGGKPSPGTRWGFHLAAQSITSSSPALQALNKKVLSAGDLDNPSLWSELVFASAPAAAEGNTYYAPRVFANRPSIDGEVKPGEYSGVSLIEFGERVVSRGGGSALPATLASRARPEFKPKPARKLVPLPASVEPEAEVSAPHGVQLLAPLTLAKYVYRYQGDTRRPEPTEGILLPDGGTALAQHPLGGTGAWMSYDRVDWHRKNLTDAKKAGVDALLAVYRGAGSDRKKFADRGLLTLTTALQSLRNNGQDYPQIALWLDLSGVAEALGERVDLRTPKALQEVSRQIARFYESVPEPFRLRVPLSEKNGGRFAYPVFLSDSGVLTGMDEAVSGKLRSRFEKQFGADLILIGEAGMEGAGLDGVLPLPQSESKTGWVKALRVSPGYDPTYAPPGTTENAVIRPNLNGETYRKDWTFALAKSPDFVVIDSWNEYPLGSAVAPTLEAGVTLLDLTRLSSGRLTGNGKLRARLLSTNVPEALKPGASAALEVRLLNSGTEPWGTTAALGQQPVVLRTRWMQGDRTISTGTASAVISAQPDETVRVMFEAAAVSTDGSPLPEGSYLLSLSPELISGKGSPLSPEMKILVKVGAASLSPYALGVTRTDLPTQLENGGVYTVHAQVRNEGSTPWKKSEGAYVGLRLVKKSGSRESYLEAPDASVELSEEVAPGAETKVTLTLPVTDPSGNPLSLNEGERLGLHWEVGDGSGGGLSPFVPVSLEPFDFGVRFTLDGGLSNLPAERRLPIRLSLQNTGPQIWRAGSVRIGYHWLYADGSEFIWEDETTGLPKDLAPGESLNELFVNVTAPPNDGTYWLVWDVKFGDTWASTAGASHVLDTLVRPVRVFGGKLFFADLSKGFNLDGITEEGEFFDGDFDGGGHTFPAPVVPPYTDLPALPSGMWLGGLKPGPDSQRRISFKWGGKDLASKNFVECRGQRLELTPPGAKPTGKYRFIHLLASSTGAATGGGMKVVFQEPTSQTADLLSFGAEPWTEVTTVKTPIGFLARRRHTRSGVERVPVALYHYTIKIGEARTPVALVLPNAPEIKIAAITLEK